MNKLLATSFACVAAVLAIACGSSDAQSEGDAPQTAENDVEATPESAQRKDDIAKLVAGVVSSSTTVDDGTTAPSLNATTDADQDGIDDALEEMLLRRYRPYYKFSKGNGGDEQNRPADPIAEIEHAQLKEMTGTSGTTDPLPGCGRSGDRHLDPASGLFTCKPDANFLVGKAKKDYCLNIEDDRYGGVSMDEAKAHATGLYGHVIGDTVNGHAAYKIEYWQFFAFNNQDITVLGLGSFGDHEGDWTSVQLWYDRTTQKIAKVQYLIHGRSIVFNMPANATPTCKSCMQTVKGSQWNLNVGNFFDDAQKAKYQDNQAEFYIDADGYRHVVVYIEHGAHEFWPGNWGYAQIDAKVETIHLNPHHGDGTAYLVPDTMERLYNAGEVDHPIGADATIILRYDAFWGCTNTKDLLGLGPQRRSPIGPAIHCEWKWPKGGSVAACEH